MSLTLEVSLIIFTVTECPANTHAQNYIGVCKNKKLSSSREHVQSKFAGVLFINKL